MLLYVPFSDLAYSIVYLVRDPVKRIRHIQCADLLMRLISKSPGVALLQNWTVDPVSTQGMVHNLHGRTTSVREAFVPDPPHTRLLRTMSQSAEAVTGKPTGFDPIYPFLK